MADYRKDFESVDEYRARLKRESLFDEPATVETDIGRRARAEAVHGTPIKPGSYYARLAFEAGCDDEYSDGMKRRHGGEW
jgi:hypothetical protein